jgi:uncharacterized protein (TIGR02246 family)
MPNDDSMLSGDDWAEIQQLFARYCWALDTGDGDAFAGTFTRDGCFEGTTGKTHRGRAALKQWIEERRSKRPRSLQHWSANIVVARVGGAISARSYLMCPKGTPAGGVIEALAMYSDQLVRENGRWRLAYRRCEPWPPVGRGDASLPGQTPAAR